MAIAHGIAYEEFIELITSNPSLEEVANFRLSDETEARISYLMEQNGEGLLTPEELAEFDDYIRLEHIMRSAKIRAFEKMDKGE